jgi:2-phosphoglycerate kinase
MTPKENRHIIITDQSRGLPYSKGLMASSLMVSGLPPTEAFKIAQRIEDKLTEDGSFEVSSGDLRDMAAGMLEEVNPRYSDSYLKWQVVEELDIPLVILLGGATGVGKSTTATQLAARLGVTRVISTDAIREVLRSAFSEELMPMLHESSFQADRALQAPLPKDADRLIIGFQRQVSAVAVGVKALIARAMEEGTDIIVEGAHVVPGFLEGWEEEFQGAALVPIVMTVKDEDLHKSHFHMRALETRSNRHSHYLESFDKIRRIQAYIDQLAEEHGVPVIEAFDLDSTLHEIVSTIVEKTLTTHFSAVELETSVPATFEVSEEGEILRRRKLNRLKSWEIFAGKRRTS